MIGLNLLYYLISPNISVDLKGPKLKYTKINCTIDDVWGYFLGASHDTIPPAVKANKHIKRNSFESSTNIQKEEGGSDRSLSNNQFSSLIPNKKLRHFNSKTNIHTNEDGSDYTLSNNKFSSVTFIIVGIDRQRGENILQFRNFNLCKRFKPGTYPKWRRNSKK